MMTKPTIQRIEMKFQLDSVLSAQVKNWARDHLGVDEYCTGESGDIYDLNTLYLDSPEFDLFNRTGVIGATKHRIRRYGNEQTLWLETKRKKNMVVRKNRTAVFESDLTAQLSSYHQQMRVIPRCPSIAELDASGPAADAACDDTWCGDWFLDRILKRRLQPAIQIAYRRFARTSIINGENLRLTIDSDMAASPIDGWNVADTSGARPQDRTSLAYCEVLELKFHNQMPHLFKELLRTFAIAASGFSKFRTAMECIQSTRIAVCPSSCDRQEERGPMPMQLNYA